MATHLRILQPTPIFTNKDYRDVLRKEMDAGKIPLSRTKFLYVPNAMLSGDSDCTVLLTFDDIARRLTKEKVVHIPK